MKTPRTHAEPTPFDAQRAQQIWDARGHEWDISKVMTDGEDEYVRKVWAGMGGGTCYMDAFFRIMKGEVKPT